MLQTGLVQIVWEFIVRVESAREFESHYGGAGTWARLFGRSPEYCGTALVRDIADSSRYVTIDTWASVESFERFKLRFQNEYDELDRICAYLAEAERKIGVFVAI